MAYNILVVDDSRTVRSVIMKALRLAKVATGEVFQAADGQEGLDVLANEWVDLIFTDINMPVMNGVEMVERLMENDLLSSIPVVVISTEGSETRISHLLNNGVRAYIRKPFKPEELREVVDATLGCPDE